MQQIVDLQQDATFQGMDIALVSISSDPVADLQRVGAEYGVNTPLLSDLDTRVSTAYDVMRWATPGGEPSHTFVLRDAQGEVLWIQDYGHADNGGRMYVPLPELDAEIAGVLNP
jgi:peroxiredoxin